MRTNEIKLKYNLRKITFVLHLVSIDIIKIKSQFPSQKLQS